MTGGRIIKSQGRVVPSIAYDEREEARRMREEAEALLASARDEIESARDQGFERGKRAGLESARSEMTESLAGALMEADRIRRRAADAATALARRMAEKIVGRTIALDPSVTTAIAERALAESRVREGQIVLHCHPEDVAALQAERARLMAVIGSSGVIDVQSDPLIARGGCVVESRLGRLDARLDVQLDALEKALQSASGDGDGASG